jgi:beta-galactosidase
MSLFVEESLKYSSQPYRKLIEIPEALPTLLDPCSVGHRMNFQGPAIQDRQLMVTHTFSSTWDAQGLFGLRDGAVWYRFHFPLAAEAKGQPLGLFLGGVEDEARVWLNGELIGTSGRGFSKPFVFDLTDAAAAGRDNVLAIQIIRNSKANEIGLGGILRPSFLFTGPRLEKKAPAVINLDRVLPGGEVAN